MPSRLRYRLRRFAPYRRARSDDSGYYSTSSPLQDQVTQAPSRNDSVIRGESNARSDRPVCRQRSESVNARQRSSEIDPEYLQQLKRRSMPHAPPRSSSLTFPPHLPPDDTPPLSPIEEVLPRKRSHGVAFPSPPPGRRRRDWGEWLMSLCSGWSRSPTSIVYHMLFPYDQDDEASTEDEAAETTGARVIPVREGYDTTPLGMEMLSNVSQSYDGSAAPSEVEAPSPRYKTRWSSRWILRQLPELPPTIHPRAYGVRFWENWIGHKNDTILDVGCELMGGPSVFGARLRESDARLRESCDITTAMENDRQYLLNTPVSDPGGYPAGFSYIEDAEEVTGSDEEWLGTSFDEEMDPVLFNDRSWLEPLRSNPTPPRPRYRSMPSLDDESGLAHVGSQYQSSHPTHQSSSAAYERPDLPPLGSPPPSPRPAHRQLPILDNGPRLTHASSQLPSLSPAHQSSSAAHERPDLSPLGPPPSPRSRRLPFPPLGPISNIPRRSSSTGSVLNTPQRSRRSSETTYRSTTPRLAEAAQMLGSAIEREFGSPSTSRLAPFMSGGLGGTGATSNSADGEEMFGMQDHVNSNALGGSVRERAAAAVEDGIV